MAWMIGICGILGNIATLYYYWNVKSFKIGITAQSGQRRHTISQKLPTMTSYLIWHLALADLLGAIYVITMASADAYYGLRYPKLYQHPNPINRTNIWIYNPLCHNARFCFYTSSILSITITLVIAIDRYLAVLYPYSKKRLNLSKCRSVLFICWLVSICFGLIPTIRTALQLQNISHKFHFINNMCMYRDRDYQFNTVFYFIRSLFYYSACCMIGVLYFIIAIYVRKKRLTIRSRMNQIERRIFAVMLCITLVNIISLLPSTALFLIQYNVGNWPIIQTALMISIIVTFLNTAINPFIYLFVSSPNKNRISRWCCGKRQAIVKFLVFHNDRKTILNATVQDNLALQSC